MAKDKTKAKNPQRSKTNKTKTREDGADFQTFRSKVSWGAWW